MKVSRLIGIHAGETKRGKIPDDDKFTYRFPLREWGWSQAECEAAIMRHPLLSGAFLLRQCSVLSVMSAGPTPLACWIAPPVMKTPACAPKAKAAPLASPSPRR